MTNLNLKDAVGFHVFVHFLGNFSLTKHEAEPKIDDKIPPNVLMVGEEKYAVVGYVFSLVHELSMCKMY